MVNWIYIFFLLLLIVTYFLFGWGIISFHNIKAIAQITIKYQKKEHHPSNPPEQKVGSNIIPP